MEKIIMAKILMIDDDPDIVMATRIPLEASGYEFDVAYNSKEGLKKVKEVNPDLIILDVMMESATEGFHVSLKLRDRSPDSEYAAYRNIPILMLTAVHTTTPLRFEPDQDYLPVDAFVDKGTDPDELLAKIEELLNKPLE
jgi:two-component system alkaline phosphatase synthesis response regulator PhoP